MDFFNKPILFLIVYLLFLSEADAQVRWKESINENWKFIREDAKGSESRSYADKNWVTLNLPHTWNNEDAFSNPKGYYTGPGWYRKRLSLPSSLKGKRLYLYFEGANQTAALYVNGQKAGTHKGGYTAFCIDITSFARFDSTNLLAVRVDNSIDTTIPPLSGDFTFYGGIYRDVFLVATNPVHIDLLDYASSGVYINTPVVNEKTAAIHIKTLLRNEDAKARKIELTQQVKNKEGKTVSVITSKYTLKPGSLLEAVQDLPPISNPHLYSPDSPYLYTVTSIVKEVGKDKVLLDEVTNPLGLRWFSFDANKGFFLNGKPLRLMGANRHQDFEGIGNALPDELHRRDMKLLREMGANFIRIAHYPQDPSVLEACDELGLLAWEEIPVVNEIAMSKVFTDQCVEMMTEMIRQHYNHPSVIIWGYMNEVLLRIPFRKEDKEKYEGYLRYLVDIAKEIETTIRKEDPARYSAIAFHRNQVYNESGLADVPKIAAWNLYYGWYHDKLPDFGKFIDEQHARFPNRTHMIGEYGAGSDQRVNSENSEQYDFSIQYQQNYLESYTRQIIERPYIAGATVWNLVDFGSEDRKETMPYVNNKGLLYRNREKKDVYYFYKATLNTEPMVYIASRDWIFRKGIATSDTATKVWQQVKVYSNLPEIEFFVNGNSIGKKAMEGSVVVFDVPMVAGNNLLGAKGYDSAHHALRDNLVVNMDLQPFNLKNGFREIGVNVGSTAQYTDPQSHFVWEAEKPYTTGSYGYVGGNIYRIYRNRIGTQELIACTEHQPLFQTARDSIQAFKFDVPDGTYELELYFAEVVKPKWSATIINDIGAGKDATTASGRVFSVFVNGKRMIDNLDLSRDYAPLQAVIKKYDIETTGNRGLEIRFEALKGGALLNAVRLRRK